MRRSLDPLEDLVGLDRKLKDLDKRLKTAVAATATTLTDIKGVGTATAAMILGEVGDVRRFPSRHHFASYTAAPIEASSGDQRRHRLSRAGNRRINRVLHIMAIVQLRHDTPGRAYYRRRCAEGKTAMEAIRALKRHLSDVIYRQMHRDAQRAPTDETGPGGQTGATLQSSADGPIPTAASSDKSQPGPATRYPLA